MLYILLLYCKITFLFFLTVIVLFGCFSKI